MTAVSRRWALSGAAAAGLGVPLLAACGGDETRAADPPPSDSPSQPATSSADPSGTATGDGKPPAGALIAVSKVPIGGGVIVGDEEVVVTQPTEGEFKAFSSICTHQGCAVSSVDGDEIVCGCHGSRFSITDGSVTNPPAGAPLPEVRIRVASGAVERA